MALAHAARRTGLPRADSSASTRFLSGAVSERDASMSISDTGTASSPPLLALTSKKLPSCIAMARETSDDEALGIIADSIVGQGHSLAIGTPDCEAIMNLATPCSW